MNLRKVVFYDFDQTVTKDHTFQFHHLDAYGYGYGSKHDDIPDSAACDDLYKKGYEDAEKNIKTGFCAQFKHDDDSNLSAIVTHHNNPHFIAGYISRVIERELTLVREHSSKLSYLALNEYKIDGIARPFFISYVPAITEVDEDDKFDEYNHVRTEILKEHKNAQILFLRETLLENELIDNSTEIHFYDDDENNINAASNLNNVVMRCYLVDGECEEFKFDEVVVEEGDKKYDPPKKVTTCLGFAADLEHLVRKKAEHEAELRARRLNNMETPLSSPVVDQPSSSQQPQPLCRKTFRSRKLGWNITIPSQQNSQGFPFEPSASEFSTSSALTSNSLFCFSATPADEERLEEQLRPF